MAKYKAFFLYALKWQVGAIVAIPSMYFFHDYLHWNNLWTTVAFQLLGAIVFYQVDLYIFSKNNVNKVD